MNREIVIKIPEEKYQWIKEHRGRTDYQVTEMLYNRVRKGTPLPKGHGKLIDACMLETTITNDFYGKLTEAGAKLFVDFMCYVDDTPTIIEADKGEEK